jgi:hypothetical protein
MRVANDMAKEMWALIPALYKRRDAEAGNVFKALIEVFGEQAGLIADDIAQLYDNWFIETCDDWVVPYIGDLIGALPLVPTGEPPRPEQIARLAQVVPQRLLVANAIRFRRRKGCFSIVEQVAHDVARWPARAVEYGTRIALNQDIRHLEFGRPVTRGLTAALRDPRPLVRLETPDDPLAHTVDVREAAAAKSPGRYGPPNVGVFVFTPLIAEVVKGDAYCVDEEGSRCFSFDALGQDIQLYHGAPAIAGLPGRITRDLLASRRRDDSGRLVWDVDPAMYGDEGAIRLWTQAREGDQFRAVESTAIVPADLGGWRERPARGFVAIDPERGRIAFPQRAAPHRVQVTYHYAVPARIGGGDYARPSLNEVFDKVYPVTASEPEGHNSLSSALVQWSRDGKPQALIEFHDSLTYDEDRLVIDLSDAGRPLVIRAAPHKRPVVRLTKYEAGAADAWRILGPGKPGVRLVLDGLTIGGRGIAVSGYAGPFEVRHCTLIPGWLPGGEKGRRQPDAASLSFKNCTGSVSITSSILGQIFVQADENIEDPLPLSLCDSILDAGEASDAFQSPGTVPYVSLSIRRCTVFGPVRVHAVPLAENTIFAGRLIVARRAEGCIRFCALPIDSRAPRRFACVPRAGEDPRLRPVFASRAYGSVGYAVLTAACPDVITRGADDGAEMGVYHDLFRPQRDSNLRAALSECMPAGMSAGVIYVS